MTLEGADEAVATIEIVMDGFSEAAPVPPGICPLGGQSNTRIAPTCFEASGDAAATITARLLAAGVARCEPR